MNLLLYLKDCYCCSESLEAIDVLEKLKMCRLDERKGEYLMLGCSANAYVE